MFVCVVLKFSYCIPPMSIILNCKQNVNLQYANFYKKFI
nr:MAG TPA: hypothetical protein [Caudoviricetes sp.]